LLKNQTAINYSIAKDLCVCASATVRRSKKKVEVQIILALCFLPVYRVAKLLILKVKKTLWDTDILIVSVE